MPLDLDSGQVIGGGLMVLVGLAAVGLALRRGWGDWRGFGWGAVLCLAAIVMKRVLDAVMSWWVPPHVGEAVPNPFGLPGPINLLTASIYLGLLTSFTLVLYTFAAGLLWRRLADDARRAFGIGVGIGAFESIFYGVSLAAGVDPLLPADVMAATPILILPAERVILIVCHTAAAAMALYAVAARRWRWFAAAFTSFAALDGLAGFYIITDAFNATNPWLLELSFAVFAIGSIPILRYLWRHWPPPATPLPSPEVPPEPARPARGTSPHARTAAPPHERFGPVPGFA